MSLENNFKIEYSFAKDIISLEPEKYKPLVAKFILFYLYFAVFLS